MRGDGATSIIHGCEGEGAVADVLGHYSEAPNGGNNNNIGAFHFFRVDVPIRVGSLSQVSGIYLSNYCAGSGRAHCAGY